MIGVIGSSGFFGSAIKDRLDAVDITRDNYADNIDKHFDVIVNANGNSKKYLSDQDPLWDFDATVKSTAEFVHTLNYDMFVQISSCEVYGGEGVETDMIYPRVISNYAFHKHLAELVVKKYCKQFIIVRSGGCVGKGMTKGPIYDITHGQELRVHPDSKIPYLNTTDLANAISALIDSGLSNDVFNVCGYDPPQLSDMFDLPDESDLPLIDIEIDVRKIRSIINLPDTRTVINNFLEPKL